MLMIQNADDHGRINIVTGWLPEPEKRECGLELGIACYHPRCMTKKIVATVA